MDLVSVIIAVYNCENYIEKSVESILDQTYSNLEVLICDDDSNDSTWKLLQKYKTDNRVRIFRNDSNLGVIGTRNFLLKNSTGEFIVIQDADDWSEKNRVERLLGVFAADIDLAACGSAHFRVSGSGEVTRSELKGSYYYKLEDCQNPFIPASIMIRRNVFRTINGYHEFFKGSLGEDLYLIIQITQHYKVFYLDEPVYFYRFNPKSITNSLRDPGQLMVIDLIADLIRQRIQDGTDWIEQGNYRQVKEFKQKRFADKRWLSEKYRTIAAVQRYCKNRPIARRFIWKAIRTNPFSKMNYITLRYILF